MRTDIKKIGCVIPSLKVGGMERVMIELMNNFAKRNQVEVHLIVYSSGNNHCKLLNTITVYQPAVEYTGKFKLFYAIKTLLFLRKTMNSIKPDAVLSFGEMYNSFVLLACLFTKHKIFVSDRSRPDKDWGFFHNQLRKVLYKRACGIIAQTQYAQSFIAGETKHKNVITIGNPIREVKKSDVVKSNSILFVGRLIKSKRIDILLTVFSQVNHEGWILKLVGDGQERSFLEDKVIKSGLSGKVFFEGEQADVDPYYNESEIFASTSNSEGFPNAVGEAMSACLPVICFDCIAGISDLVDHEATGFIVYNDDVDAYIRKLSLLMESSGLRRLMGEKAKEKIQQFETKIICDRYFNFLTHEC